MSSMMIERPVLEKALATLRQSGNPFRNYFARNPDDDVCAHYHVAELYATEREMLLSVVDLYRNQPATHSEIVPILGNKGSGKTHLLHSIKHGGDGAWQLLVTPGVYQKEADFLEYLLFQIIDTLLGGGKQRGIRPLDYVSDQMTRKLLGAALAESTADQKLDLFPAQGIGRWTRKLGLGFSQAQERCQWLVDQLNGFAAPGKPIMPIKQALTESGLSIEVALDLVQAFIDRTEPRNTAGLMRRAIHQGFVKAQLIKDEAELANFLTFGFAELDFQVRPSRQDLVLALFKVLMESFRLLKTPVVVAFDQLEDLLLSRRSDDAHKIAETFFAGIVQVMHQVDGLCFLVFAERGLWNRFVPSLDGYIQDRLNNPIHLPRFGTIKALRLEAPPEELVHKVVEQRMNRAYEGSNLDLIELGMFPFTSDQISRVAKTEPTLRDMLQQYRHLFDHMIFGPDAEARTLLTHQEPTGTFLEETTEIPAFEVGSTAELPNRISEFVPDEQTSPNEAEAIINRLSGVLPDLADMQVNQVEIIEVSEEATSADLASASKLTREAMLELYSQELRVAKRKLEPEGSLTGATRELQAGLGSFLLHCHEHGVKVGPWRLQHVVPEFSFGEHPTYGTITIAHWACKDGQPWKVGIGLFLARGAGKPRDLEIKLGVLNGEPALVDHLILLRPEDDLSLTGKSKTLWNDAEKRGRSARLEPLAIDGFATISSFPRWLTAMTEAMPEGIPLPNLADIIQEQCEKLLEQVCMPTNG
jgi:hypothetical protein